MMVCRSEKSFLIITNKVKLTIFFIVKIKIKIKKLYLTSLFETDNISSVELLLRHNG